MAILTGIGTRMKGSAGDWTYSRVGGSTIAKQKMEKKENPSRSFAQMARRVRWRNIQNMWAAFEGTLRPSFEGKAERVSDANAFMSANIGGVPVYLTKEEAKQGACVVAAYEITHGSLPSIGVMTGTGDVPVSNIALGSLVIDDDTTLKQFSNAVVNNNPSFMHGDQISCYIATQEQNSVTGIPYAKIKAYEVTLNQLDEETLLSDLVPANGFSSVDGKLGASGTVIGGIAWVHSRKVSGRTLVSSQSFFVNNALLSQYQTAAKRIEAILSYGGKVSQLFLVPNTDMAIAAA
jgi:hypothetical protein